jgi:hypothetical protein
VSQVLFHDPLHIDRCLRLEVVMESVHERCCGLDVHQAIVVACVLIPNARGAAKKEIRSFSTMTDGLRALAAWRTSLAVTHVAMERTGVYWMPIDAVLEEGALISRSPTPSTCGTSRVARPT